MFIIKIKNLDIATDIIISTVPSDHFHGFKININSC